MRIENSESLSTVFSKQNTKLNKVETVSNNNKTKETTISDISQIKEPINYKVSEKTISKAVDDVNKKLTSSKAECKFSVHKATGQITVKVMDKETGDVIREIPSEKILDIVATALEMAGILVDEKR